MEETKKANFQDFLESYEVHNALKKAVASEQLVFPTMLQQKLIPFILGEEKSLLVKYEDDSGIKLGYLLPIINYFLSEENSSEKTKATAIILAHNKKRMNDINEFANKLTSFCSESINVAIVTKADNVNLKAPPQIIITNPKVFLQLLSNGFTAETTPFLVLDQVEFLLQMDFKEELEKIGEQFKDKNSTIIMTIKTIEDTDSAIQDLKKIYMEKALVVRFKQSEPLIGIVLLLILQRKN